jgi:hypothetical protein
VPFLAFLDSHLIERARDAAKRNVWKKARADRPAEHGIGRIGFFRCGGCGRALSVIGPKVGHARYACGARHHATKPYLAPVSISVDLLDEPLWRWVQRVLADPSRADAWRVVSKPAREVAETAAKLAEAERHIATLETEAAGLLANFSLLSGPPAAAAAVKLNATYETLEQERIARDALAASAVQAKPEPITRLQANDVISDALVAAIAAMKAADPNPERTIGAVIRTGRDPQQVMAVILPDSWAAKRAALSVLGLTVTVSQEDAGLPRWVTELRLSDGTTITGEPDRDRRGYMSSTSPMKRKMVPRCDNTSAARPARRGYPVRAPASCTLIRFRDRGQTRWIADT